jgi:hypothetical protein
MSCSRCNTKVPDDISLKLQFGPAYEEVSCAKELARSEAEICAHMRASRAMECLFNVMGVIFEQFAPLSIFCDRRAL